MKRYFDIIEDKITLEISVSDKGMRYSVEEIEKVLKINGLREINKEEFNKLTKLYTNI